MQDHLVATSAGTLNVRSFAGAAPTVVGLHGFTLHGGMFGTLAECGAFGMLAADLPGHGKSRIQPIDLDTTLDALATWIEGMGSALPILGYSQGGRIALHLAVRRPDLVQDLILVSTSTGLSAAARPPRKAADDALADHIETVGIGAFLDEWLRHPLVGTHGLAPNIAAADRHLREGNTAAGLAGALRGLGQGVVPAIEPSQIPVPTTWIVGTHDERYVAAARGYAAAGHGVVHEVVGAGHNVVLEAPTAVAEIVAGVLSRLP